MDRSVLGTAAGGAIRVIAATTTALTAEAVRRHRTSPTVAAALGRMLTGTLLLGSSLKDFDRLTARMECTGPVKGIVAEVTNAGLVRGYVNNPAAELPARSNGKFDVSGIVGEGTFYVVREAGFDIGLGPEPYVGSVPIVSGEIAEDFAYYLAKSEQIPSAVLLGVLLRNSEPYVAAAGGIMLQMMPGANEHIVTIIEDTIRTAPQVTSAVNDGAGPEDLVRLALGAIDHEVLESRSVEFRCSCSIEKAFSIVSALGRREVASMLEQDAGAEMNCGFCNETYRLNADDLKTILENI